MSEQMKLHKWSQAKRWLRSWLYTPLGKLKIRLIKRVKRKRGRTLSDSELKQIIFDALTDRYPTRYFRERTGLETSPETSHFSDKYCLSLVDLGSPTSFRRGRRQYARSLRRGKRNSQLLTLAVATVQPHDHRTYPRSSWLIDWDDPPALQVINPDLSSGSSSEVEHSPISPPMPVFAFEERIAYETPAIIVTSSNLHAESISEKMLSKQPHPAERANRPVIADFAPCIPDLYFIDRPDPPLSCVITQTLRDSNSPALSEGGICSCSSKAHISHLTDYGVFSLNASPPSITQGRLPKSAENAINRACGKRNAFLMHRAKHPQTLIWPEPLSIRKNEDIVRDKIRNGPLPPIPMNTSHETAAEAVSPYNLYRKLQDGTLPPVPSPVSSDPPRIPSTCISSYEPGTPSDIPPGAYRPSSLCNRWLENQARRRALHSHPYGSSAPSTPQEKPLPPYPASPQEAAANAGFDNLPDSLRAGRASLSFNNQGDLTSVPEPAGSGASSRDSWVLEALPDLAICLHAGAVAQRRRQLDD